MREVFRGREDRSASRCVLPGDEPGESTVRVSAIVLCSLLGMGGTSAAVTWMTPAEAAWTAKASEEAADDGDAEGTWKAAKKTKGEIVEVAAPAPKSTFRVDGPLRLEGRLGHSTLPGARDNETFVLVEVAADDDREAATRAPVNLAIVIDRSGSMKGQRMTNATAAARGMLARLRPDDTVSLVTYHERAELLVAPTRVDRLDRFAFDRTLASIRSSGNTCISCGIDLARSQIRSQRDGVNRILLLSDGVANRGLQTPEQFRALGDVVRREETAVASVGVDVDYDQRMLFALSQASNGNHYFVENPAGLTAVFDREAEDLTSTIADRVDVDIRLADGVQLLEVIARGHRRSGDDVTLSFGTFNAGEDKSALLRVRVESGRGEQPIADVRMAYRDLADDRERSAAGELSVALDPDETRLAALDPYVEERLGRKETLDALLLANEAFARGDLVDAQRQLDDTRGRIRRRRTRSGATGGSKLDKNFERQLDALGSASSSFSQAAQEAPAPAAAPRSRKGKSAVRANAELANPFG
jgi:Ca-activated chloride channel family protein